MKILGCGAENAGVQSRQKNKESPATQRGTPVEKLISLKVWRLLPSQSCRHSLHGAGLQRLLEIGAQNHRGERWLRHRIPEGIQCEKVRERPVHSQLPEGLIVQESRKRFVLGEL